MIPLPTPNIEPIRYLPIGGTGHADDPWATDDADPFTLFMRARNFEPIRPNGQPWIWSGKVSGLWFFTKGDSEWYLESAKLSAVLEPIPFVDRNLLCHSDAGQLAIILAASGFRLRTLTTFGTPNRRNLPSAEASQYITYWQHLYDREQDWMASLRRRLGQIGDGSWSTDRSFEQVPGIRRVPLDKVSHSKLLRDPACFHWLEDEHVLDGIKTAGGVRNGC